MMMVFLLAFSVCGVRIVKKRDEDAVLKASFIGDSFEDPFESVMDARLDQDALKVLSNTTPEEAALADAETMMHLINKKRAEVSISRFGTPVKVAVNRDYVTAAMKHAKDILQLGRLTSVGSDGSSATDRVRTAGCKMGRVTDISSFSGRRTQPGTVLRKWLKDSGKKYTLLGKTGSMGYARVTDNGKTAHVVVMGCWTSDYDFCCVTPY